MALRSTDDIIIFAGVIGAILAFVLLGMLADYGWTALWCTSPPAYVGWTQGYVCPDALRGL